MNFYVHDYNKNPSISTHFNNGVQNYFVNSIIISAWSYITNVREILNSLIALSRGWDCCSTIPSSFENCAECMMLFYCRKYYRGANFSINLASEIKA